MSTPLPFQVDVLVNVDTCLWSHHLFAFHVIFNFQIIPGFFCVVLFYEKGGGGEHSLLWTCKKYLEANAELTQISLMFNRIVIRQSSRLLKKILMDTVHSAQRKIRFFSQPIHMLINVTMPRIIHQSTQKLVV